jgi:hypothetical protein
MSNQERIGLEGMIKAYAGCSRIIATTQRASSTELPAESGEKRRRAVPVKVRPFCASKQQKKPIFIDSKPASENREGCRMTYAITWGEATSPACMRVSVALAVMRYRLRYQDWAVKRTFPDARKALGLPLLWLPQMAVRRDNRAGPSGGWFAVVRSAVLTFEHFVMAITAGREALG